MLRTIKHSSLQLQPMLGGLAYWSEICVPMFSLNNDRSTEISKVREGWDG